MKRGIQITEAGDPEMIGSPKRLRLGDPWGPCAWLVLQCAPGDIKQHPLLGADLRSEAGGTNRTLRRWRSDALRHLQAAGLRNPDIKADGQGGLTVVYD